MCRPWYVYVGVGVSTTLSLSTSPYLRLNPSGKLRVVTTDPRVNGIQLTSGAKVWSGSPLPHPFRLTDMASRRFASGRRHAMMERLVRGVGRRLFMHKLRGSSDSLMRRLVCTLAWITATAMAPLWADSTVVFNEIMYNPAADDATHEWIELHNQMGVDMDISGWSLRGVEYVFPEGTIVQGRGFVVVAISPEALAAATALEGVLGPFSGRLANGGERLELLNNNLRVMDSIRYRDEGDWPLSPDGSGHSLTKRHVDRASDDATNWRASVNVGGTPGAPNAPVASSTATLAFSETYLPESGASWVELIAIGGDLDLGGLILQSRGSVDAEFVFPSQNLRAGALIVVDETTAGFEFEADNRLFVFTPDRQNVVASVSLDSGHRGQQTEALADTSRMSSRDDVFSWFTPMTPTPGADNQIALNDDIVINEIMYHPKPTIAQPEQTEDIQIMDFDATWKYDASGQDLGTAWREPEFDDSAWPSGQGLFFNETATLAAEKNTEIPLGIVTYYFRTTFEFSSGEERRLVLQSLHDDGIVVYLNGAEIHRSNMANGPVVFDTLAFRSVGNARPSDFEEVSAENLRDGTNTLAVEIHQSRLTSNDVVFGLRVFKRRTVAAAIPFSESDQAWIELYNQGASPVDLSGWALADGIDFEFPTNTLIGAGEHLVVANDRELVAGLHPGARVVGNFTRRLSHRSDHVTLRDSRGNLADSVTYFDSAPWPAGADAGGSSLELIDPRADNENPGAWAASDETSQTGWREYSYTHTSTQEVGPTRWREFIFGLLDDGEILIDDLEAIDTTDGSQLIGGGDFEFEEGLGPWRAVGNHRASQVIEDPDDPTNRVLHLIATGGTEHMSNHLEATLPTGIRLTSGRIYVVTFRARWLTGSNQLNTRFYFNRAARTTAIAAPTSGGTPGRVNSQHAPNVGPTLSSLSHSPGVPTAGEAINVSVAAHDPDGVARATLWWTTAEMPWQTVEMLRPGSSAVYNAAIPSQPPGTLVQFYVEAEDTLGEASFAPSGGPDSRALVRFDDGRAADDVRHNLRLLMTPEDTDDLHEFLNVMSNDRIGATLVYDESEIFYDVGVRLKGSERGRPVSARVGFNVRLPADHLFRGVHRTIAIDRSGGWRFGGPRGQDEILIKHMINHAGGIPGMYDDMIHVIAPQSAHDGSALLLMARYRDVYLDSQWPNGGDGTAFEFELIYFPTSEANGFKRPQPDDVLGTDLVDRGDDKEAYRWNFLAKNNTRRDDYASLIRFLRALGQPQSVVEETITEFVDIDSWMRTIAMISLCGVGDTYMYGLEHNGIIWIRPEDGRALYFPWDLDFAFVQSATSRLPGGGLFGSKVANRPPFRRILTRQALEIIDTTFNPEYMRRWIDHYGAFEGRDYGPILSYIAERGDFIKRSAPEVLEFSINTNDGEDFVIVNVDSFDLEGVGWVDIDTIARQGPAGEPLNVVWTTDTEWKINVDLPVGDNDFDLVALDSSGNQVGSDAIRITRLPDPEFIRGDADLDTRIDMSDAILVLNYLFTTSELECDEAADANGDDDIDISDPIFVLNFLYVSGSPPAAPYPEADVDEDREDALDCLRGVNRP